MHKLAEQEHHASRATVGRLRQSLEWTTKATQLIREANKLKRVEFCQRVLEAGEILTILYSRMKPWYNWHHQKETVP